MDASDSQALAALGATSPDDGTAAACLHADQEPMGAGAADFGSLVGAFHDGSWEISTAQALDMPLLCSAAGVVVALVVSTLQRVELDRLPF